MKILLVDPPGKNKGLNTGLAYLSALLRKNHEVIVLDLNNREIGQCGDPNPEIPSAQIEKEIIEVLQRFQPELFGVSVKTFTAKTAGDIFKFAKSKRPNMLTIVGGPHITLEGYKYIQENEIDYGIQGEGEYTICELCTAIEKNEGLKEIEGIYFWENDQLIHNPRTGNINDMDALPFPYYGNFTSVQNNEGRLIEYPILTSRGCPYKCSYCSMPKIMGSKWRSHSPDRVIQELLHARQKYSNTSFTVVDDNFTLNLKRVETICDMLVSENIDLPWNSQNGIRADRINNELANKMAKSGCRFVWIGIESADETVFNKINKGEKLSDIKAGIRHLKNAGIRVGGFFITGLPFSTRESDLKSVAFVKKQGIDGWWFNFVPYPYTKAFEWVQNHASILQSIDGVLQFGSSRIEPVFETDNYSKAERIRTYQEIHIRLHHFDRLADLSLTPYTRWKHVLDIVASFGKVDVAFFLLFLLKYHLQLFVRKLAG